MMDLPLLLAAKQMLCAMTSAKTLLVVRDRIVEHLGIVRAIAIAVMTCKLERCCIVMCEGWEEKSRECANMLGGLHRTNETTY